MYIAEISPARHRGRLVSLNQFAIVFGMLLVYFVNYFIVAYGGSIDQAAGRASEALESWNVQYGWRWMFASEALPASALFVLLFFVPESPRWLAARGRDEEASRVLARVDGDQFAEKEMAEIRESLMHGKTNLSMTMLQKPVIALLLVYGLALAFFQQATGINVFLYFAPDLFKSMAGENIDAAMLMTIVVGAANLIFTVVGILAVDKVGRKPLMVAGYLGMALCMAAIGISAMQAAQGNFLLIFMIGYIACFAFSVGPVTWVLLSEIFPTRVRGQLMAAATVCLWASNFLVSQTFPMMDKNEALVEQFNHGFPFLIYGGVAVVAALFVAIFIPETKGKSLEEFENELYSDSANS
jgi:SP family xylose:H+ symportor-like MFS transporter